MQVSEEKIEEDRRQKEGEGVLNRSRTRVKKAEAQIRYSKANKEVKRIIRKA